MSLRDLKQKDQDNHQLGVVTTGDNPDANRYNIKLGLNWIVRDQHSLRANYDYSASDHFSGNTWLIDYRYDF